MMTIIDAMALALLFSACSGIVVGLGMYVKNWRKLRKMEYQFQTELENRQGYSDEIENELEKKVIENHKLLNVKIMMLENDLQTIKDKFTNVVSHGLFRNKEGKYMTMGRYSKWMEFQKKESK